MNMQSLKAKSVEDCDGLQKGTLNDDQKNRVVRKALNDTENIR